MCAAFVDLGRAGRGAVSVSCLLSLSFLLNPLLITYILLFSSFSVSGRPSHVSKLRSEFDRGNRSILYCVFVSFLIWTYFRGRLRHDGM